MDGKIPPGSRGHQSKVGASSLSPYSNPEEKGSFSARDVTTYPASTHIPASTADEGQQKPLSEWEIATAEIENTYFQQASAVSASGAEESGESGDKHKLAQQLKNLSETARKLVSDYNRTVVDMGDKESLSTTDLNKLRQRISANLGPAADQLAALKKQAGSSSQAAAKRSFDDIIQESKAAIKEFNKQLSDLKETLHSVTSESVTDPAIVELTKNIQKLEQEAPKTPENELDSFSNKVWLQLSRASKYVSDPKSIKPSWSQSKKEQAMTSRQLIINAHADIQDVRRTTFKASDLNKKKIKLNKQEARKLKQKLHIHLANVLHALGDFSIKKSARKAPPSVQDFLRNSGQPVQPESTTPSNPAAILSPSVIEPSGIGISSSQLHSSALKALMEEIEQSQTSSTLLENLSRIHQHMQTEYQKFQGMEPLLAYAAKKSKWMKGAEGELIDSLQQALENLKDFQQIATDKPLEEAGQQALKKADIALSLLDSYDRVIPERLYHLLTEALPDIPQPEDHLLNLMGRHLLQAGGKYFNAERDPAAYQPMADFLDVTLKATKETTQSALNNMLNKTFNSQEAVAEMTAMAKSTEEIAALGPLYAQWSKEAVKPLKETEPLMNATARDFSDPKLLIGVSTYHNLSEKLEPTLLQEARETASERFNTLQASLQQHIIEIANARLQDKSWLTKKFSPEKVCAEVAKELNEQLQGLAGVAIPTVTDLKEAQPTTIILLNDSPTRAKAQFNSAINKDSSALKELRQKLSESSEPICTFENNQCHWTHQPPEMVKQAAIQFGRQYHEAQQGIELAKQVKPELERLNRARSAVNKTLKMVDWSIPPMTGFSSLRRSRKKAIRELQSIQSRLKKLDQLTLQDLSLSLKKDRNRVMQMLKERQISTAQATAVLKPIFALLEASNSRLPDGIYKLKEGSSLAPPNTYKNSIAKLKKSLNVFHQLFRSKKWQALQHAKVLESLCQTCQRTPAQAIQILAQYSSEMSTIEPYYRDLNEAFKAYKTHLEGMVEVSPTLLVEAY